jgi:hypothetical protein
MTPARRRTDTPQRTDPIEARALLQTFATPRDRRSQPNKANTCETWRMVNRIEFEYVDER